ncbi:Eco57I restriction-modification methylase domain-containing protein [Psychrobacter faecalis]
MQLENLSEQQAIDKVLSENLHGLELDQRCVELAVFALALEAWRYKNGGGYRKLPELNLACSGLSINAARDEWKALSRNAGKQNLSIALDWMYQTFQDAPVLGSLINPRRSDAAKIAKWNDLQQLLVEALEKDQNKAHDSDNSDQTNQLEAGIVAQGLVKAAELLSSQYTWVVTNVPYLGRGNQDDKLKDYCERYYPEGKNDLATVFLERCLEFCIRGGMASVVLPQNWLFLTSYRKFREKLLSQDDWRLVIKLGGGAEAFEVGPGNITNIAMVAITRGNVPYAKKDLLNINYQTSDTIGGLDVTKQRTTLDKARRLILDEVITIKQTNQLENPDARVTLMELDTSSLLSKYANFHNGIQTGDYLRYGAFFWELDQLTNTWSFYQSSVGKSNLFGGRSGIIYWQQGFGEISNSVGSVIRGTDAWKNKGVSISATGNLYATTYSGELYDENTVSLIAIKKNYLPPIWAFCSSANYYKEVRTVNQSLKVRGDLIKVPFDLEYWTKVAEEQYPNGLPEPYTNDPTQWIFHAHPCGSVVWDKETKRTAKGELRVDESVLQVAVARLLGYQWPAELNEDMELATEQRELVVRSQELNQFTDDEGIVCLPAVRGEKAADQRLEALLQAAYGDAWTTPLKNRLLETVKGKSLNQWLRDKFFEQHCKMFQHRPFIWHIWDGLNDGFSALVNYHMLDKAGLERLIYTYLGDWIRTQQSGMASGEDGAQERLAAAEALKRELEAILEGEAPYDIFVRWKSLAEQSIGWNPDLNDGVRLNIRPFLKARDVGKKDAGVLRWKPNIKWTKDRGKDVESAPWYTLGLEYEGKEGDRINDHHLTLADKHAARENW